MPSFANVCKISKINFTRHDCKLPVVYSVFQDFGQRQALSLSQAGSRIGISLSVARFVSQLFPSRDYILEKIDTKTHWFSTRFLRAKRGADSVWSGTSWCWCCASATFIFLIEQQMCRLSSRRCWYPAKYTTSFALATSALGWVTWNIHTQITVYACLLLWNLIQDLCLQEVYDYLKTVCTDIHITRGNFDEAAAKYPEDEVRGCP